MDKKQKVQKNIASTKVQGYTGHEVISLIYNVSKGWVSKVLLGKSISNNDYKYELERYKKFQKAYISKRKMELGTDS